MHSTRSGARDSYIEWLNYSSLGFVRGPALPNEFAIQEPQILTYPGVPVDVLASKSLIPRKPKWPVSMAWLFSKGLVVDPRPPIFPEYLHISLLENF